MNRRELKQEVVSILKLGELEYIFQRAGKLEAKKIVHPLFSCLCHPEEKVRWHAVSLFGFVMDRIVKYDMEAARIIMRRFLWMLNDESGGIGWGVPEAMGEVMFKSTPLANEYLHMLVSYTSDDGPGVFEDGNLIEHPVLQQGVLWGIHRVAGKQRDRLYKLGLSDNLELYLKSDYAMVRGLACRLVETICPGKYLDYIKRMECDKTSFRFYKDGNLRDVTVADMVLGLC